MGVEQRFRDSGEYELLEPYLDSEGLLAGYRVERLLYRDPWRHTTYEASTPDGRRVALKLLHPRSGESRRAARRVQQRVRQRASIEHPHLLPIFDWGELGDQHYLVTPLCREFTLADLLGAGGLKAKACLRLLTQLADALETAHEHRLVHRELAPENVFVAPRGGGHVLLDDFGVANPEWGTGLLDLAEPTAYLSPERLRDEPLTAESNVYSLACILVECLTGSPPYVSELPGVVAYAHAAEPPPRLSELCPELPPAMDDLVGAAMAKDPQERLRSPRRLVADAARCLGLEPPAPQRHDAYRQPPESASNATPGRLRKPRGRMRGWAIALGGEGLVLALAAVIAACGALGFVLGRSGADERQTTPAARADPARRAEGDRAVVLGRTGAALARLDARRAVARTRIATAPTRARQAAHAARLADDYRAAARRVPTKLPAAARVTSLLNEAGQAYGRLAVVARRGDRRGYRAARRAVRRSERDLRQAIAPLSGSAR